MLEITRTKERINLKLDVIYLGEDLCIILTGGDKPHLGAVTVGSNQVKEHTFCFPHHKEDYITKLVYSLITESFDKNVIVCCGIHFDNISKEEITEVISLCKEMILELKHVNNI
ncbi:hypothetical protein M2651_04665 [Clostridium sp. SYSU_GA19001]|uniref:prenylated flavin chaperone LpdD n=1 Tax=Clostridium caldaquaticum TaxID=2940653 RepID=UPI00207718C7|nr:hypothetical protein [Clostridium caldaquaticum]MCM8710318.1 hypothetical protein [Clostridium caldaquaticum]